MKGTAIYAITPQGARLGRSLANKMGGDLYLPSPLADAHDGIPFDRIADLVEKVFGAYPRHVFIAAAGIVVRAIAPFLRSKDQDPAVVVLDQRGRHVISLLSGHLGGANDLALQVARLTGGTAVITTATDTEGILSMDLLAREREMVISNLEAVRKVNMALLEGRPVQIFDPEDRLGLGGQKEVAGPISWVEEETDWHPGDPGVWVTWSAKAPERNQLVLHPPCLIAGVGCNRGTAGGEILALIRGTFEEHGLALHSLKWLASIDDKQDEPGLMAAARELNVPLFFYSKGQLDAMEVPHPSEIVRKHMGVPSVCEATALLRSRGGRLLIPKTKSRNVTLAVALERYGS